MRKQFALVVGCMISTAAFAQLDSKQAIEKWRACADATAIRFAKSTESAPVVARLAAVSCASERKQASQAVAKQDGESFAEEYIGAAEKYYMDILSLKVIEFRLKALEKH